MLASAKFWTFYCKTCTSEYSNKSDCHQWLSRSFRVKQIRLGRGSTPDPAGGAYSAPHTLYSCFKRAPLLRWRGKGMKGRDVGPPNANSLIGPWYKFYSCEHVIRWSLQSDKASHYKDQTMRQCVFLNAEIKTWTRLMWKYRIFVNIRSFFICLQGQMRYLSMSTLLSRWFLAISDLLTDTDINQRHS